MSSKKNKDTEFEIRFYEKLIESRPRFVEALSALGDLYTKVGMHKKGLAIDLRLVELKPDDPIVLYNLACSYSLLERIELALETLKQAIEKGYKDLQYLQQDEDLLNLRKDSRFNELITNLKK